MVRVQIGGAEFPTMAAAKVYMRKIIEGCVGRYIDESNEHWPMISALWQRSPNFESGLLYFEASRKFKGCAIKAVTSAGNIDWSIRSAISGKDVGKWTKLTLAMRTAIRPQTVQFRYKSSKLCEICGSGGFLEVDHTTV
jgi:hypothetical protein